ncbi:sterol desaturase family protein [Candidatus Nitrosacidococcus tergens]|uniref:Fatty acid hydroxylase domain-containing protein n=1 Tax=Candidatus Nitrosacidococcus tergens TaxID=553981 RepID=A0A7G1Q8N9_9GAMM|nr:sterol desaturase family protein [Candidatus Nitrosacidococcus tergens]CAB1275299.1 conserved membrane protein of unknown function [Candidatus Nitrosacidococcus tergens]
MNALIATILHLSVWLFLLCAIFVPLERAFKIEKQDFFRAQFWVDLGYYMLNGVVSGIVLTPPLAIMGGFIYQLIPTHIHEILNGLPGGTRLALSLMVGELGFYWAHRLTHAVPLLWRFHAIHHSAKEVDFLTNTRAHPVDILFTRICTFLPVLSLGLTGDSSTVTALFLVIGVTWGFFIHANIRWRFGLLENFIASPFFHHWHHTNMGQRDRNYASMLPILDHIFGTYISPKHWPTQYGIDAPMPASFFGQLIKPFLNLYSATTRRTS